MKEKKLFGKQVKSAVREWKRQSCRSFVGKGAMTFLDLYDSFLRFLMENSEGFIQCDPDLRLEYFEYWYANKPVSKGQFRYYLLSHDPFDPILDWDFIHVGKNPSRYAVTTDKELISESRS